MCSSVRSLSGEGSSMLFSGTGGRGSGSGSVCGGLMSGGSEISSEEISGAECVTVSSVCVMSGVGSGS